MVKMRGLDKCSQYESRVFGNTSLEIRNFRRFHNEKVYRSSFGICPYSVYASRLPQSRHPCDYSSQHHCNAYNPAYRSPDHYAPCHCAQHYSNRTQYGRSDPRHRGYCKSHQRCQPGSGKILTYRGTAPATYQRMVIYLVKLPFIRCAASTAKRR